MARKTRRLKKKGGVRAWNTNDRKIVHLRKALKINWLNIESKMRNNKLTDEFIEDANKDKYKTKSLELIGHKIAKLMEESSNKNILASSERKDEIVDNVSKYMYNLMLRGITYGQLESRVFEDWAKGSNGAFTPNLGKHTYNLND